MREEDDEMTSKEIKDNAPDGATHYAIELGIVYYIYNDGEDWYIFEGGSWSPICYDDDIKLL